MRFPVNANSGYGMQQPRDQQSGVRTVRLWRGTAHIGCLRGVVMRDGLQCKLFTPLGRSGFTR